MSVRVVSAALALWVMVTNGVLASGEQDVSNNDIQHQVSTNALKTEERALADLSVGMNAFILTPSNNRTDIHFNLPPNVDATEAWLRLAARPASTTTNGNIHVSINNGDAITIRPEARAMEARFALFSSDLHPGENTLTISYSTETASAGWIVDATRSRLRLTLDENRPIASLEELETTLSADFAAPRRIALISDVSRQRATLEGLVAQGIALRAGSVPIFSGETHNADLIIRIAENGRLETTDRELLRNGRNSQGPEIAFSNDGDVRLIITGRNIDEAAAAARLFAARSFVGYDQTFLAADAVAAHRLGQRQTRDARNMVAGETDLRTFATSGLPFSADQGSRTAVQIAGRNDTDRYGALSVLARAALVSGEAWLYAWYGESHDTVPAGHNVLVIGPDFETNTLVERSAPAELHAAMRAAERSRGQRGLMRFAAAAYADDGDTSSPLNNLGVAALFANKDDPGHWVATLTAPDLASFEAAGRSLARSDLWQALEGRAAVWSERGVTPYDFSYIAPTFNERVQEFAVDHTRDAAFVLFGLAFFMLIRGIWRRRRVHAT